ncbi:S-layer homology domain-containing protein [Oscillibacter valericigenes]|uniref:S-layer homology domain-containing protein n=1 Tax=Oscillibacter valericigenes TaxID=351091 RepID=UPI001F16BD29|nr:S-layer homology domain-containing protein [Oscillibacter valericigenes]MCF2618124.1 S-layer homology domain-containing protein [Oscillibacter valericigenes]
MKRIFTFFLAIMLAFSCVCFSAIAVEDTTPFEDIMEQDYYYNSVLWAVENGITGGVTENLFKPAASCTRAQVVTFLWRANGRPEPAAQSNPFKDITEDDYFYKAVLWAVEKEITGGVSIDRFAPNQHCTRAHAITFLWRSKGCPMESLDSPMMEQYSGEYFYNALKWAEKSGLIWEDSDYFEPREDCPRADIVTYIHYVANPNAVPNSMSSASWIDHINKYYYINLVGTYDTEYGDDTAPLQIGNAGELAAFATFSNSSMKRNFSSKYVMLTQDIDLGMYEWVPISKPIESKDNGAAFYNGGGFMGTFSGGNYLIKNLNVNRKNSSILGLFGALNCGTIRDVSVSGNIIGNWNVGGIAAYNMNGKIINCNSCMTLKSDGYCVGGIVGQNCGGSITDCSFSGTIAGNKTNSGNVGGIAGWCGNGIVEKCMTSGTVTGNFRVGGIVGRLQSNSSVLNCICTGKVSGVRYYDVFVGMNDGKNNVISGCTTYI